MRQLEASPNCVAVPVAQFETCSVLGIMASPATAMAGAESEHAGNGEVSPPQPVLVGDPGTTGSRKLSGKGLRIAVVATRWYNDEIVHPLVAACCKELKDKGVAKEDLTCVEVAGAFELPFVAGRLIEARRDELDAVVCIGCMVKGATMSYEFVSEAVTMGIMKLNVKTDTPVVFGVLTAVSKEEAKACTVARDSCGGSSRKCNHGVEWAQSALEMARLKQCAMARISDKCRCNCHCDDKECRCGCHCTKCDCQECTCSDCKCTSCEHRGKGEAKHGKEEAKHGKQAQHGETKTCGGCGHRADQCQCKKKKTQDAHVCTGCGQSTDKCECKGCNCAGCKAAGHMGGGDKSSKKECGSCCK